MAITCALFADVGPSFAEDRAAARQAYAEGSKYYDLNQYTEALEAFKRAYWNHEDPAILFNIAQCHRALKHRRDAIDFYKSYLRKEPQAANRDEVERVIAELETALRDESSSAPKPFAPSVTAPTSPAPVVVVPANAAELSSKKSKKHTWIWAVVASTVAVGVGLGIGLGLGLQSHAPTASDGVVHF